MSVFFVSYDLRGNRNYETLYDELNRLGAKRVLESVWSLKLSDTNTCKGVRDHLMGFIDGDDGIIVLEPKSYTWNNEDNAPHKFD